MRQRHRDEGAAGSGLLGDRAHLIGAEPHRLFHHERLALVEQVVRGLRHAAVRSERDDEVRPRLDQHLAIVREGRRVAHLGRAPGDDGGVGIVQADEPDVGQGGQAVQVRRVPERVPVADLDRGDADRAGARHCQSKPNRCFICAR